MLDLPPGDGEVPVNTPDRSAPLLLLVLATALPCPAAAESYLVLPDGSGDFPTIEAAVDSVSDGDEILLGNGTFTGPQNSEISYQGKAITIRSQSGDRSTVIIDCQGNTGFVFRNGEGPLSVLSDLTITNAEGYLPGAIYSESASPQIRNVAVRSSRGIWLLGGSPALDHVHFAESHVPILVMGSAVTLTGCVIEMNTAIGTGGHGALYLSGSDAVVDSCVIRNNTAHGGGGAVAIHGGSPHFRDCILVNNEGGDAGGAYVSYGSPTFERCTFSRNEGIAGGIFAENGSTVTLDRTIVWGNCGTSADEILVEPGSTLQAGCSDLRLAGVGGGGSVLLAMDVIDYPPMFCVPQPCGLSGIAGAYGVDEESHVIHAACGQMGALAADCDIGIEPVTWGRLKALYR